MTSQRLLSRRDRPLGNSILQSGASLGAIATPIVVLLLAGTAPESWRHPVPRHRRGRGFLGRRLAGVDPADRPGDQADRPCRPGPDDESRPSMHDVPAPGPFGRSLALVRRFLALAIVVIMINWCWQYFRAWMPGMLREQYGYGPEAGPVLLHRLLPGRGRRLPRGRVPGQVADGPGLSVHGARMTTFLACCRC